MAKSLSGGYTVGVTFFVNGDGDLGLHENGLRQNAFFLHQLFKAAPGCARAYLLNQGDGEPASFPPALGSSRDDVVHLAEVADRLDAVIVCGGALARDEALRLRDRGCRVIAYKGGNGAVISMEAMAARPPRPDAERYYDRDLYDAIWMTPQHLRTYRGWCETLYRCPVIETPQIWAPLTIAIMPGDVRARFGYRPGRRPWRIGLLEPNTTVMKTSHMPMLACEAAFRERPEAMEAVYVTNGAAHRHSPHFESFARALTLAKAGRLSLEPRFVGPQFLANHADAVVTHHWENGLNYLYYEALHGGYPLIHNAPLLGDVGYAYGDFDAQAGGRALLDAWSRHDDGLELYRTRAGELFGRLDPRSAAAVALHEGLVLSAQAPPPTAPGPAAPAGVA